jgi:hypothetical protein
MSLTKVRIRRAKMSVTMTQEAMKSQEVQTQVIWENQVEAKNPGEAKILTAAGTAAGTVAEMAAGTVAETVAEMAVGTVVETVAEMAAEMAAINY